MKKINNPDKMRIILLVILIILTSCSTAPKNSGDVYNLRRQAEAGLKSANSEAAKGNFNIALSLLTDFKRSAVLTDDSSLIIRICLARGNIMFSLGSTEEAFMEWDQAISEAQRFKNIELLAVSRIFKARGDLMSNRASAQSVLDIITRESQDIKSSRLYSAFAWQVRGLTLSSLRRYSEAEEAIKNSLNIHEKDKLLENASYDWYIIASIRSLAGNTAGALQALNESIILDRRIENSWGIASSYRAMGDVYTKTGRSSEAKEAYERARAIYVAMGNDYEVAEIDKKL
ncbi:MAG: tetratricopeptide repeat protein [Treponema sp.]|nr:tetratricopeptide repeat protein [Treponema sp.]